MFIYAILFNFKFFVCSSYFELFCAMLCFLLFYVILHFHVVVFQVILSASCFLLLFGYFISFNIPSNLLSYVTISLFSFYYYWFEFDLFLILCCLTYIVQLFLFYFFNRFLFFLLLFLVLFSYAFSGSTLIISFFSLSSKCFRYYLLTCFWFCFDFICDRCHFRLQLLSTLWHMLDKCVVITFDTIHTDILYYCCYCIENFSVCYRGHVCLRNKWRPAADIDCAATRVVLTTTLHWLMKPCVPHSPMKCTFCVCVPRVSGAKWSPFWSDSGRRNKPIAPEGVPHAYTDTHRHTRSLFSIRGEVGSVSLRDAWW